MLIYKTHSKYPIILNTLFEGLTIEMYYLIEFIFLESQCAVSCKLL